MAKVIAFPLCISNNIDIFAENCLLAAEKRLAGHRGPVYHLIIYPGGLLPEGILLISPAPGPGKTL
jgi:hypothetical protein